MRFVKKDIATNFPRAFTLDEAATALRISRSTAKTMIGRGLLRVVRIGRRVIVSADEVERLLRDGAPMTVAHDEGSAQ